MKNTSFLQVRSSRCLDLLGRRRCCALLQQLCVCPPKSVKLRGAGIRIRIILEHPTEHLCLHEGPTCLKYKVGISQGVTVLLADLDLLVAVLRSGEVPNCRVSCWPNMSLFEINETHKCLCSTLCLHCTCVPCHVPDHRSMCSHSPVCESVFQSVHSDRDLRQLAHRPLVV